MKIIPLLLFTPLLLLSPYLQGAENVTAHASVTVSDGTVYTVKTFYQDQQKALFRREYPDRLVIQEIDGAETWQSDGVRKQAAGPQVASFVLGHQFHAQMLWPEQFYLEVDGTQELTDPFGNTVSRQMDTEYQRLQKTIVQIKDGPRIEFTYEDWRKVGEKDLPFVIFIDDGDRQFRYDFEKVQLASNKAVGDEMLE
jgi:hypothetical protein